MSVGLRDFDIAIGALHHAHFHFVKPFDQTGFVSAEKTVFAGARERAFQQLEAKYLRGLRQHQVLAGQGIALTLFL